ncbi:ciliary neurotrophic factor isoform X1 [Hippocampus zosterae]|uniref:ciliary neurotrophic factor isoform X1 n=1 Tax=Hippocampus zosterae TaxID=109293 RepID=UPI00223DE02B|nr:ciliary neurotrophic factor isoform X1 [Hippocampus zosterae]XP_051940303.1 ciliary neurotrophic factor isoform X1 [Hippocampus zosterae]XP_051940304.1 ciliary neurotrophic factor isoform X1 [Hippocampus zosterae]XP_051940305.1 ciliary neurotrophic factor isoform X1 [Hippocampus zosterae]
MADRRSGAAGAPDQGRTTAARAAAIAELLLLEISNLLELYSKRETFTADVIAGDSRLVSVPPPSSQLDTPDKLWRLHAALIQCRGLMERAIAKEDEEMGSGTGEYETLRKMVKERLSFLINMTGELVKAVDGPAMMMPSLNDSVEPDSLTLFELKLWVFRVFTEVDYWAKTAVTILQALPKERVRTTRHRSTRSSRR